MKSPGHTLSLLVILGVGTLAAPESSSRALNQLPADFIFGSGTSSYQVEGAWNEDGKGENIYDHWLHNNPNLTVDGSNGDVACDSYHKYETDIQLAKNLSVSAYRFSISWSRILPTGDTNVVNQKGIDYYNNLINGLLENNIEPLVTMFHYDLPQKLQDIGGWPNPRLVDYFVECARILYDNFGDRVKWWQTINEPRSVIMGYSGSLALAPGIDSSGVGDYMAVYTLLKAHAAAYRLYDEQYRATQQGKVGIAINIMWFEPATNSTADIAAADRKLQFYAGIFGHPIFSAEGDYPEVVKQRVANNSRADGYARSRLVEFTPDEVEYIRGTADFFGVNHYTSFLASDGQSGSSPSISYDAGVTLGMFTDYPVSAAVWFMNIPWGFRKTLNWVNQQYPGYPIFVLENGWPDSGEMEDQGRIDYYTAYLSEMVKAVNEDGVDVIGYVAWSLMDNFEWATGFTIRYGIHHVDFDDPDRKRTPKASSAVLEEIFRTKAIPEQYFR
ncbi:myrosinase 1-like [Schistocerca americana]|uniref:myrosinase 1-like n=1 Tax=Schistocerca americana TaxID=7009 RepID=UPI001F4FE641|nr:myrosinase 1-like [Schistocerca americana]